MPKMGFNKEQVSPNANQKAELRNLKSDASVHSGEADSASYR